jgi:hypothetical protein
MILTTARLLLREIVESDWQAVFAYQSDPRYRRHYPCILDIRAAEVTSVGETPSAIGWNTD